MAERKTCANPGCERKFTAKHNNKNGKPRVTPIIWGSVLTIPKLKPE